MSTGRLRISALAAALAAGSVILAGCGGGDENSRTKPKAKEPDTSKCERATQPKPRRVKRRRPPAFRLSPDKTYTATVTTTCGTFRIELDSKHSPKTGGSFVTLAREGFYDGLTFHRIVTGFVIQGGDPRGDGSGGPGYSVREAPPSDVVYSEGVVAMAKTEVEPPGTSGSQFFVVTADSNLPPVYALLGRVTTGLDVVHRIELIPAQADGMPVEPIVIKKIAIAVS